jgi:hypothetical protein
MMEMDMRRIMTRRERPGIFVFSLLLIIALALVAPVGAVDRLVTWPGAAPTTVIGDTVALAADGDVIVLSTGMYQESGEIVITGKSLTFRADTANGSSREDTGIDAGNTHRIFTVTDASSLTIDNLTLQKGKAAKGANGADSTSSSDPGPGVAGENGGAISSAGPVMITTSAITGCSVGNGGKGGDSWEAYTGGANGGNGGSGGAISTTGTVTVISSAITGCGAGYGGNGGWGGATVDYNFANGGNGGNGGSGGAIYGTAVTVTSSIITGSSAGNGGNGGIGNYMSHGYPGGHGGNGGNGGSGGAIYATGTVTVTSSTLTGSSAGNGGTAATCNGGGLGSNGGAGTGSAIHAGTGTLHFSRVVSNAGTPVVGSLNAENNWWGTNSNPSVYVSGADANPWLVLTTTATPPAVTTAQTSVIRASLTTNSDGTDTSVSGHVPDGIPVTFAATGTGSVAPGSATTTSGAATATYTPGSAGTAMIRTTVDGDVVFTPVTVTSAGSGAATSIVIDPAAPATLYAGLDGSGIYRSSNGGGLWLPATTQPGNLNIRALAINPSLTSRLYAGTYGGGVYRSTDSGDHWAACTNTGLENLNVLSLVSNSTGGLYAGTENGVYTSPDCNTWTAINGGLP